MRVNYILPRSEANGPGTRFTIWVQGCSIHCPGCSNTDAWSFEKGENISVKSLAYNILTTSEIDGVTITGGEPLDQLEETIALCRILFGKISVFVTTGYTKDYIDNALYLEKRSAGLFDLRYSEILKITDILCTGPFDKDLICSGEWKGSSNQEIHYLTAMGKTQSRIPVTLKEFFIKPDGQTLETGFTI